MGPARTQPASLASPPRDAASEVCPPSPADLGRLLDAAAEGDLEFWTYLRLASSSGARRSQMCGLRWSDVDLERGRVTFARAVVDGLEGIVVKDGKTHRAYSVAIDPNTTEVLRRHLEACRQRAALCGVALAKGAFVFSFDPDGTRPWRPDVVTHRFARLRLQVGLPTVRLHDLRHYVATRLLAGGAPARSSGSRRGTARQLPDPGPESFHPLLRACSRTPRLRRARRPAAAVPGSTPSRSARWRADVRA